MPDSGCYLYLTKRASFDIVTHILDLLSVLVIFAEAQLMQPSTGSNAESESSLFSIYLWS
jgi:hypothetical protein